MVRKLAAVANFGLFCHILELKSLKVKTVLFTYSVLHDVYILVPYVKPWAYHVHALLMLADPTEA